MRTRAVSLLLVSVMGFETIGWANPATVTPPVQTPRIITNPPIPEPPIPNVKVAPPVQNPFSSPLGPSGTTAAGEATETFVARLGATLLTIFTPVVAFFGTLAAGMLIPWFQKDAPESELSYVMSHPKQGKLKQNHSKNDLVIAKPPIDPKVNTDRYNFDVQKSLGTIPAEVPDSDAWEKSGFPIQEPQLWRVLPMTIDLPLPPDLKQRAYHFFHVQMPFNEYPILRGDGSGIFFYFPELPAFSHSGEKEQAYFVKKVLQAAFPRARFNSNYDSLAQEGEIIIEIQIMDKWEYRFSSSYSKPKKKSDDKILHMQTIKPANGTAASLSHEQIRELMGIPPEVKVISLYVTSEEKTRLKSFEEEALVYSLFNETNADIIFKSSSANPRNLRITDMPTYNVSSFQRIPVGGLGEKLREARAEGKKLLVINDTSGRMSAVHSAADLEIVIGPINLFEGLIVGTPTIICHLRDLYLDQVMMRTRRLAEATGGAITVSSLYGSPSSIFQRTVKLFTGETNTPFIELVNEWLEHLRVPLERRPYLIPNHGETPFDRFLQELREQIQNVLKAHGYRENIQSP